MTQARRPSQDSLGKLVPFPPSWATVLPEGPAVRRTPHRVSLAVPSTVWAHSARPHQHSLWQVRSQEAPSALAGTTGIKLNHLCARLEM